MWRGCVLAEQKGALLERVARSSRGAALGENEPLAAALLVLSQLPAQSVRHTATTPVFAADGRAERACVRALA